MLSKDQSRTSTSFTFSLKSIVFTGFSIIGFCTAVIQLNISSLDARILNVTQSLQAAATERQKLVEQIHREARLTRQELSEQINRRSGDGRDFPSPEIAALKQEINARNKRNDELHVLMSADINAAIGMLGGRTSAGPVHSRGLEIQGLPARPPEQ